MIRVLCPKGVSTQMKKELMEASVSVVSLTGKSASLD
jgi:hypothetical protein